ncbi:hypothetical protein HK102_006545 [Quaeritorhiza haematococci]|nr:hypothetical protein HK102_006545 [Quaeritorhiza haematococci]
MLLTQKSSIDWNYTTTKQPKTRQRAHYWPRGKGLGGSSSTNAVLYVRGSRQDYNDWEKDHGCEGWGFENVLPYFKKIEAYKIDRKEIDEDQHGYDGPLRITRSSGNKPLSISKYFIRACNALGLGTGPNGTVSHKDAGDLNNGMGMDFNGRDSFGSGIAHMTVFNGIRQSTLNAYLKPIKDPKSRHYRPNLTILTNHHVTRIVFADTEVTTESGPQKKATGVMVASRPGQPETFLKCSKDVIISAGAINSPQLLLLSGIGPKEQLERHGISVVKELSGVGQNLQDHPCIGLTCEALSELVYSKSLSTIARGLYQYVTSRSGLFTNPGVEGVSFFNTESYVTSKRGSTATTNESNPPPPANIQFHFLPLTPPKELIEKLGWDKFVPESLNGDPTGFDAATQLARTLELLNTPPTNVFGILVTLLKPVSRGHIRLQSNNSFDAPEIEAGYLTEDVDLEMFADGYEVAREVVEKMREMFPGAVGEEIKDEAILDEVVRVTKKSREEAFKSRDYIKEQTRRKLMTLYHPVLIAFCYPPPNTNIDIRAVGTCKMGPSSDPTSVVDPKTLRVHGFSNLRVADASIMPVVPSGNTNAPSIMIGERCADIVKGT